MRIIRQADSAFRYYQPPEDNDYDKIMPEDEWFEKARLGPEFDKYSIDNHESADDAHDLGFVTPTGGWNNRLYKVDHGIVHEIYPRGHSSSETSEQVRKDPRWIHKVTNIPESPDIISRHHTLDDAISAVKNRSWTRGIKRPKFDDWSKEIKEAPPGTPFVTSGFCRILDPDYAHASGNPREEGTAQAKFLNQRAKDIKNFHDAWDQGTHDPYSRQDFDKWG